MKHLSVLSAIAFAGLLAACSDSSAPTSVTTSGTQQNPGSTSTQTAVVPASVVPTQGQGQSATVGTAVTVDPAVVVKDASGNPLAGVTVTFNVTNGGSVQYGSAITNAAGVATAGHWTLGTAAGTNYLDATAGNVSTRLSADGLASTATSYNITVRWLATATARQQQAVTAAVARWQSVITGDVPDVQMNAPVNACFTGQPAINEKVDDIIIYVEFVNIDGAGQVLGEAGPCYVRNGSNLPVVGHLKLDAADLAVMERSGTLDDVVLHEMGHILGIGTLWPDNNLITGSGGTDPRFIGSNAVAAYHKMGGLDADIAVENTGADGTRDGHWRESVFGNELMTGYISGAGNPMSEMTIASLKDLGYGTNSAAASTYTLTHTSGGIVSQGIEMHGHENVMRPKFKVDVYGKASKFAQ